MAGIGIGASRFLKKTAIGGVAYGPYTTAFQSTVVSRGGSLTTNELTYLNTFETSLGSDISQFDRLWIHGLSNSIAARTSFVNSSSTAITAINSPNFAPGFGYTGDAASSYLDTNYNLTSSSVKYTQNNACIFLYSRTDVAIDRADMGAVTTAPLALTQLLAMSATNSCVGDVNAVNNTSTSVVNSKGFYSLLRTASSGSSIYKNGSVIGTGSISSILPDANLYLLARNLNGAPNFFSPRQISVSGASSGAINQANFYSAVQALGTSIGWAV